jgi:hypothetical protein
MFVVILLYLFTFKKSSFHLHARPKSLDQSLSAVMFWLLKADGKIISLENDYLPLQVNFVKEDNLFFILFANKFKSK